MKKFTLILLAVITLFACSSDDDSSSRKSNDDPLIGQWDLVAIDDNADLDCQEDELFSFTFQANGEFEVDYMDENCEVFSTIEGLWEYESGSTYIFTFDVPDDSSYDEPYTYSITFSEDENTLSYVEDGSIWTFNRK